MRILMLILLVMSGASIWGTLAKTPAFNPNALGDTVVGNGRVPLSESMYDPGEYAFQRGFGYLMADALISSETESRDELAADELAIQRAQMAQTAIEKAIRLDPGNGNAWAALSWAFMLQGEGEKAAEALRVSWEIAPYNRTMAETRISLVGVLSDPDISDSQFLDSHKMPILRDASVLELHDEAIYNFQKEQNPHLFVLIDDWKSLQN